MSPHLYRRTLHTFFLQTRCSAREDARIDVQTDTRFGAVTLWAMRGYGLTGARMKEIQAVNAARRADIASGMGVEEAMERWKI